MAKLDLVQWKETKKTEVIGRIRAGKTISAFDSACILLDGFEYFQKRRFPSSLSGVSFTRIAGQAVGLQDEESRHEVRSMLKMIKSGGVFLILAHGGKIPCGAVAAKKKAAELAEQGRELKETESVIKLVERIPDNVVGIDSPHAEEINADAQATKILEDPEFGRMIREKNITVVTAVFCDEWDTMQYSILNRDQSWDEKKLVERHPKLIALREQLAKGLAKSIKDGIDLGKHYAHAIFVYDPLELRTVLDPNIQLLEVGGICCVDARLKPNTPDSPKYLFRIGPNQTFDVTVEPDEKGNPKISVGDRGSREYADKHVAGVKTVVEAGEEAGNGHLVCVATSLDYSMAMIDAINSTGNGNNIKTAISFNGQRLRMLSPQLDINVSMEYDPEVRICEARVIF